MKKIHDLIFACTLAVILAGAVMAVSSTGKAAGLPHSSGGELAAGK